MNFSLRIALAAGVVLLAGVLPSCSGGGSGGGGGGGANGMFVQTCSLGCSSGNNGTQVSCAIVNTYVNKDVAVVFSDAVDPSSIDNGTFQLIDVNTGQVPVGERLVDPTDPRKIIFRPSINIDLQGNVNFGFSPNTTYRIVIPGTSQNDPGPFIRSVHGENNQSRMQCDIQTTLGVVDYIPGPPTVQILVDTIDPNTQVVTPNVDAHNATNVAQNSTIRFVFNDIMSPTTLADQVTHQPTFVSVLVDLDGDLATVDDQVPLFGNYTVATDLDALQTVMTFTSPSGLPSSGDPATHAMPRKVLITCPSTVTDLAGNGVSNPSTAVCTPQVVILPVAALPSPNGETFSNTVNLDTSHSGADWDAAATPNRLTRGFGGGSGRLGELVINNGETVTLNTDNAVFPLGQTVLGDVMTNLNPISPTNPGGDYPPGDPLQWPKVTVADGIFEFSALVINPGGTLKITGTKPARVFSRGTMIVNGTIDVSGASAPVHMSSQILSDPGALGGPFAGDGGAGSSRMDNGNNPCVLSLPPPGNGVDIDNDNAGNSVDFHPDGGNGGGVGRSTTVGAPPGGLRFPAVFPVSCDALPTGMMGQFLTFTNNTDDPANPIICMGEQPGSPGSGGTYSSSGSPGVPIAPYPTNVLGGPNAGPPTPPGATFSIDAVTRKLDADFGNLRGGAGGSGGGLNLISTQSDDSFGDVCASSFNFIAVYVDNSGAAGGGGGGAIQLVSGQSLTLAGIVLANGGVGGSAFASTDLNLARDTFAAPGGGGSGGAVRLQAKAFNLSGSPVSPAVSVVGGAGGVNAHYGHGGAGGAGLVRIEQEGGGLNAMTLAPAVAPFDMTDPTSSSLLSVGAWTAPRNRPETYSAAVSCWLVPALMPDQNYFSLDFVKDDLTANPPVYGWNMDIIYDSGTGEHLLHYRDPSPHTDPNYPAFPNGEDFETFLGNKLNHGLNAHQGSYLAVRFQGAVSKGTISDFCNVQLAGPPGVIQIVSGSLTPWVSNPADLNLFNPPPNMVRFTVVFDKSLAVPASVASFIKGVTNLKIQAKPD